MEILDCKQRSEEWYKARLGSIGGSSISSVVAKGQGKMRKNLMYRLAGEILSGQSYEGYSNQHMQRGIELEDEARDAYACYFDTEVNTVGLIRAGDHMHYSPDGLLPRGGILEVKCPIPSIHIEMISTDKIDIGYIRQVQYGMFICERYWTHFESYCPAIQERPIYIQKIERDSIIISELIEEADKFINELLELVNKIRS